MLRFKLLLSFFLYSGIAFSQSLDSAYLVKYASPLTKLYPGLMPGFYFPNRTSCDSSFLVRKDGFRNMLVADSVFFFLDKDTVLETSTATYRWNADGRLVYYRIDPFGFYTGATYSLLYKNGKVLNYLVKNPDTVHPDSLRFSWNRSGQISAEMLRFYNGNSDSVIRSSRLFDNLGRLMAITNASYGPSVYGDFAYEFDTKGRLVRRTFLTHFGGAILATDTFIYSHPDSLRQLLQTKHFVRPSGKTEWILIDEKTERIATGQVLEYRMYHGGTGTLEMDYYPGYYIKWEYDAEGRIGRVLTGDIEMRTGSVERVKQYFYSGMQLDSVRVGEFARHGDKLKLESTSLETYYYDAGSNVVVRSELVTWQMKQKKRRKYWQKEMDRITHFTWK